MSVRTGFDAARRLLGTLAVTLVLAQGGIGPALAGGPLDLYKHQPVVYPNGAASVTLNLDQGALGGFGNAQAVTLVQNAIAMWNGVGTSTARLAIGAPLAKDYTSANYKEVFQQFNDTLNPIVFDSDGEITDAIFGTGAKSYILGFAGSVYATLGAKSGK
jgi:hypothetical protein